MLKKELVPFKIYFSLVPFVLIRIPDEEQGRNKISKVDILDQTRIHHEHYKLAMKIAADACYGSDGVAENQEVDKTDQILKCKEVIAIPSKLKNLNLKQYYEQLDMTNQGNMRSSIDLIIQEFKAPFADPR
jgi:transcriptional accessory protein Tex/SPT6